MPKLITNGLDGQSLRKAIATVGSPLVKLKAAVAFFVDTEIVESTLASGVGEVQLIVSLTPPTDYYALAKIYWKDRADIRYISEGFHSKIYLCESSSGFIATVGSSNLTGTGLEGNIETNVLFNRDEARSFHLHSHYKHILSLSEPLTPDVLDDYKEVYDDYRRRLDRLQKDRRPPGRASRLGREAFDYLKFWKVVDFVRRTISDERIDRHFPGLPPYLAVDHFWYFIASQLTQDDVDAILAEVGLERAVTELFERFATWEPGKRFLEAQPDRIDRIQSLLSLESIDNLSVQQAQEVHRCLHCVAEDMRWGHDSKMVLENELTDIQSVWKSLLHGDERVERRIDGAMRKLRYFGPSSVMELNGWFRPQKFPIRNSKADKALAMLGLWNVKPARRMGVGTESTPGA